MARGHLTRSQSGHLTRQAGRSPDSASGSTFTLTDGLADFLVSGRARGLSPKTLDWYRMIGERFAAYRTGRGALGGLRREEQIDRPAECQVPARMRCPLIRGRRIRCPKIREVRCPNHVRRLLRRTAGRRSGTICRPLVGADHNILWFGEELAGEEGFEPSIS